MKQVTGTVRKINDGIYEARIWSGWYVAFGRTAEEAKKKVLRLYYKDQERLTLC